MCFQVRLLTEAFAAVYLNIEIALRTLRNCTMVTIAYPITEKWFLCHGTALTTLMMMMLMVRVGQLL